MIIIQGFIYSAIQVVEHQVKSSPSLDERLQPQREDFYMFQDHIVHDQEMDFLDALKEALIVPYKNINIIIFCLFFFTSLTLFCFLS